mgnify:CR=1 FL=1|tara:strand:+ start:2163 stop:4142 length:1980 start_codon:yes stop_codon:yes gene_type:complete
MPTTETIKLQADVTDALKGIDKMTKAIGDLEKAQAEQSKTHQEELKKATKAAETSAKSTNMLAKGFKGVGLAMKAAGFSIIMKIVDKVSEALMKNQEVADAVETVFAAIGIVFKEVSDTLISVFKSVSDATGGFDALQKVIGGLLTIAITPLKMGFYAIKLALETAQLAWEESFFGDGDPETIKRLNSEIEETKKSMGEVADEAITAGKQVADNFSEAVGEVGSLVTATVDGVSKVIEDLDIKQTISRAKNLVELRKNYERVALEQQRLIEKYDEEAELQRQIRDDVSISIADRIAANKELGEVLKRQIAAEQKAAQANINNLKQQIKLEGESEELKNSLYSAETELLAISAKVTGLKSEQLTNLNGLLQEQNDLTQTGLDAEQLRKEANAQALIDQETDQAKKLELQQQFLDAENEQALIDLEAKRELYALGTQARVDAEQEYKDKINELEITQAELDTARVEQIKADEEAKRNAKLQSLDTLQQIFGAESAMGKAALIAKQLMAAQELLIDLGAIKSKASKAIAEAGLEGAKSGTAVAGGLAKTLSLGFPAAIPALIGYAGTAVGIVSGVMGAIKKTKSVAGSMGGSGGGGGGGSVAAPAPPQPISPSFNVVGNSETNQLADVLGDSNDTPVQAYVVAGNVTTAQSLERNVIETTSL